VEDIDTFTQYPYNHYTEIIKNNIEQVSLKRSLELSGNLKVGQPRFLCVFFYHFSNATVCELLKLFFL